MGPSNDASSSGEQRPDQMTFQHFSDVLAPLDSFDPGAFLPRDDESTDLAAFVLALALAFNDIRAVMIGHVLLNSVEPDACSSPRRTVGLYAGLRAHLHRTLIGVMHELLALLERDRAVLEDSRFELLIRTLSSDARRKWRLLCAVAIGEGDDGNTGRLLARIRNKVVFHYDSSELLRGFESAFGLNGAHGRPLVSRGNSVQTSQFFFADAAAQRYFMNLLPESALAGFPRLDSELLLAIHQPLFKIVTAFIQSRGGAWRAEESSA